LDTTLVSNVEVGWFTGGVRGAGLGLGAVGGV